MAKYRDFPLVISDFFRKFAAKTKRMNDKFQERINGSTPHGGAYLVAYFRDATGSPCVKEKAKTMEIVEYDSNDSPLFRAYGSCH